jgi:hypothetical protein
MLRHCQVRYLITTYSQPQSCQEKCLFRYTRDNAKPLTVEIVTHLTRLYLNNHPYLKNVITTDYLIFEDSRNIEFTFGKSVSNTSAECAIKSIDLMPRQNLFWLLPTSAFAVGIQTLHQTSLSKSLLRGLIPHPVCSL